MAWLTDPACCAPAVCLADGSRCAQARLPRSIEHPTWLALACRLVRSAHWLAVQRLVRVYNLLLVTPLPGEAERELAAIGPRGQAEAEGCAALGSL